MLLEHWSDIPDDGILLRVDTKGACDGVFTPSHDQGTVEIEGPYGQVVVGLSSRCGDFEDVTEAACVAVEVYDEKEGKDVPWPGMGQPFYHVTVNLDGDIVDGVVRLTDDFTWRFMREPE